MSALSRRGSNEAGGSLRPRWSRLSVDGFSRAFDGSLQKDFVVVHWDQRNAGKSHSLDTPVESYTLDQIVDDGLQVTEHLKRMFGKEKFILVGHSWGTLVAANMVKRHPASLQAYVSVGTAAEWKRGEELR